MTNSRASKSKLELLDKHLATGTEANYTYTPSTALDMKTKYREITVIMTGKATAALALQIVLNGLTDYDHSEISADTTTLTTTVNATSANQKLISAAILDTAASFYAKATIVCNDADDQLMIFTYGSNPLEGIRQGCAQVVGAATTITSILIDTSTSTWIAGTEISTYGLKR